MIVDLAAQRAMDRFTKVGFDRLSEAERILATVWLFAAGVANHGFAGYYGSRRADLAFHAPAALRAIGAHTLATIAVEANAQFGSAGPSPDPLVRAGQVQRLGDEADRVFEAWFERQRAEAPPAV